MLLGSFMQGFQGSQEFQQMQLMRQQEIQTRTIQNKQAQMQLDHAKMVEDVLKQAYLNGNKTAGEDQNESDVQGINAQRKTAALLRSKGAYEEADKLDAGADKIENSMNQRNTKYAEQISSHLFDVHDQATWDVQKDLLKDNPLFSSQYRQAKLALAQKGIDIDKFSPFVSEAFLRPLVGTTGQKLMQQKQMDMVKFHDESIALKAQVEASQAQARLFREQETRLKREDKEAETNKKREDSAAKIFNAQKAAYQKAADNIEKERASKITQVEKDSKLSDEQKHKAIVEIHKAMNVRARALEEQYKPTFGAAWKPEKTTAQYTEDKPATPTSKEEFDKLKSGDWFINPADGKKLQKK